MMHSTKIGLVGTGFIAHNLATLIRHMTQHRYDIAAILTRREIDSLNDFPYAENLTNSLNELIDKSDLIIECSGDVLHATVVTEEAQNAGLPVLTMNSEFHVTTGSYFSNRGYLSECHGDQPGCIAALKEEAEIMGFKPLILGNFKGFLDENPALDTMQYWADRQQFTVKQTTSFTDGTKVQIEQAFVANAFDATIFQEGLLGVRTNNYEQTAKELAAKADALGAMVSDYIISDEELPSGIFIAGTHNGDQGDSLQTYKLGPGPYYVLNTSYHLCAFEILKTVNRYLLGLPPLLNVKSPNISVAAIAKKALTKDSVINSAIGSMECRGEVVFANKHPQHVPIGVLENARLKRDIDPGQIITFDDIDIEPSRALEIVQELFI